MKLKFWSNWLAVAGLVCVAGGLAMVFFFGSSGFSSMRDATHEVFWQGSVPDKQTADFERWINAVLGAVIAGWGLMLAFIARSPFRRGERWAWGAVAWPFSLWFVFDTAASLFYNVTFNAALNTVVFVLVAIPLVATWKRFRSSARRMQSWSRNQAAGRRTATLRPSGPTARGRESSESRVALAAPRTGRGA